MLRSYAWLVKPVLTAIILAAIAWKLDVAAVLSTLASVAPYSVAAGLALVVMQAVSSAGRLCAVVGVFGRRLPLRDSVRVTFESMFFAQTFLSFLGADALRIWRIRRSGLSLEDATAAIALDRLIGMVVNHCLLLAALPWLLGAVTSVTVRAGLLVLAAAGVAGMAVLLTLGFMRGRIRLVRKLPAWVLFSRLVRLLLETSTVGRHLLLQPRAFVPAALLSLVIAIANCLIFFVVLLGLQVAPGTAMSCALLVPAVLEIAMLPISIAGWGVREGVAIVAFGALGVPAEIAFGSSVAFALIILALGLLGGLLWLFDYREMETMATVEAPLEKAAKGQS